MEPEPSWSWPPGHELAPGLLAWALLGDGRRCETWLAWDLGRWCPVVVKLPRPGGRQARAVAALTALSAGAVWPGTGSAASAKTGCVGSMSIQHAVPTRNRAPMT